MRPKLLITAAVLLTCVSVGTADAKPVQVKMAGGEVNADALKRVSADITYLASDALEGRGVETTGIVVAAEYIREEFKKAGLKSGTEDGSFYQYFDVPLSDKLDPSGTWMKLTANGKQTTLEMGKDYQPNQAGGAGTATGEIVFVGYGISAADLDYDDYAGVDVKGKVVLMIRREPQQGDKDSKFDGTETTEHSYIATKLRVAKAAGAAGVLFVNDGASGVDVLTGPQEFGGTNDAQKIPFAHITRAQADRLIGMSPLKAADMEIKNLAEAEKYIDETYKPISQPLGDSKAFYASNFKTKSVRAWNVIGVVEGEGPLADETVVVGAHYDHLGFGGYGSRTRGSTEVHNGADDNATGTAAVIELARRFANPKQKPARRMVFIAFSGEERGLIGSAYYAKNPTHPIDKTIAMLNFDMIGNLRDNKAFLGGSSTGSGLQEIAEAAAKAVPVSVEVQPGLSGGSDHLNFVRERVPVLFCNTGLTALYHTPEDDTDTLNLPGTVMVVDYCEELLKGVVSMSEKPGFQQARRGRRRAEPRVYLGVRTTASDDADMPGMLVTNVVADSPGAKAGLEVGDLLQKVGDKETRQLADIFTALSGKKPGDTITVKIVRDGEEMEVEIELAAPRR